MSTVEHLYNKGKKMECWYELRGVLMRCPVDDSQDEYAVIVESRSMIAVEELKGFIDGLKKTPIFQEDFTRCLADRFGASVTTTGDHSGVYVTCFCS